MPAPPPSVKRINHGIPNPGLVVVPIDYRENMLLSKHLGEIVCPL